MRQFSIKKIAFLVSAFFMLMPLTGYEVTVSEGPESVVIQQGKAVDLTMIEIPDAGFMMSSTEVPQSLYTKVMGINPCFFRGSGKPVECISWYDAIYFCNKLSELMGYTPVYSVGGKTNPDRWGYVPHAALSITARITVDAKADGFRLPTQEEWEYAARGGEDFIYSGSDDLDEVAWCYENSGHKTHPVAQKMANGYGLYDMSGNVWEWCWDSDPKDASKRCIRGGCFYYTGLGLNDEVTSCSWESASYRGGIEIGFRVVRNIKK